MMSPNIMYKSAQWYLERAERWGTTVNHNVIRDSTDQTVGHLINMELPHERAEAFDRETFNVFTTGRKNLIDIERDMRAISISKVPLEKAIDANVDAVTLFVAEHDGMLADYRERESNLPIVVFDPTYAKSRNETFSVRKNQTWFAVTLEATVNISEYAEGEDPRRPNPTGITDY